MHVSLPMAAARFSSEGVAICYVLPTLWMTSCLQVIARNSRPDKIVRACSKWLARWQRGSDRGIYSNWIIRAQHWTRGKVWYLRLLCCRRIEFQNVWDVIYDEYNRNAPRGRPMQTSLWISWNWALCAGPRQLHCISTRTNQYSESRL